MTQETKAISLFIPTPLSTKSPPTIQDIGRNEGITAPLQVTNTKSHLDTRASVFVPDAADCERPRCRYQRPLLDERLLKQFVPIYQVPCQDECRISLEYPSSSCSRHRRLRCSNRGRARLYSRLGYGDGGDDCRAGCVALNAEEAVAK